MSLIYKMLDAEGKEVYVREEHVAFVMLYEGFTEIQESEPCNLYNLRAPDYSMYMKE